MINANVCHSVQIIFASVHSVLTAHAFPRDPVGPFATLHPFLSTTLSFPFSALLMLFQCILQDSMSSPKKKPSPASISLLRNVWIRFLFHFCFYCLFICLLYDSLLHSFHPKEHFSCYFLCILLSGHRCLCPSLHCSLPSLAW